MSCLRARACDLAANVLRVLICAFQHILVESALIVSEAGDAFQPGQTSGILFPMFFQVILRARQPSVRN